MSKVLIVVDMQNDFVTGPLGTPEAQAIVPHVEKKILEYLSDDAGLVMFTRDTHFSDYYTTEEGKHLSVMHCLHSSDGWQIIPELKGYSDNSDGVYNKFGFGYDSWTDVFMSGNSIESIELVGVCTDICVISNAIMLKSEYTEIPIVVDASCCAGTTPENHAAALQVMKCCQIEVIGEK